MDLSSLLAVLHKNRFSISYKNAKKHLKDGDVKSADIKVSDDFINIYGRVKDGVKLYFTQVRINKLTCKVEFICNCDFGIQIRKSKNSLACEHAIATALKVLESNKCSVNKVNKQNVKILLSLEQNFTSEYRYKAALYLEGSGRIKITSKKELDYNVLSREGSFFINYYEFSQNSKKLFEILKRNDFKVCDKDVRNVLFYSKDSMLSMKIDSIIYKGNAMVDVLPLKFTLKVEENDTRVKLQGIKLKLIELNSEGTAFLYNGHIYIPPISKCRIYKTIYKAFNKKFYTYVKIESLERVIEVLKSIGDLKINNEVINIIAQNEKIRIIFSKKQDKLYFKFDISKGKEYLIESKKVKKIEEILYQNKFTKKDGIYIFVGDNKDLISILQSNLNEYAEIIQSDSKFKFKIVSPDAFRANLAYEKNNLLFDFDLNEIDKKEILSAVNEFDNGSDFYRFSNYSFFNFKDEQTKRFIAFLKFIGYKGKPLEVPNGYEELFKKAECSIDYSDIIKKDSNTCTKKFKNIKGLNAELRKYQKQGVMWLQDKKEKGFFGILADDMGLGKTIMSIAFILKNPGSKTIIVSPASLVYNWFLEFSKFAPGLNVLCVHGNREKRIKSINSISEYDVLLTSYGTLKMDIDKYKDYKFDHIILDEAQTIKNKRSKISEVVKSLNGKVKFALTGTPIENNYLEIWNIFDFLKPGYLFSEKEFKLKFSKDNYNSIEFLKFVVKPFILRRTKNQVLKELPEKIEKNFYVDMTIQQKKYYKDSLKRYIKEIEHTSNHISILSFLTKLRQAALDPSIIDCHYKGGSGKINAAIEIINDCVKAEKKILIFSQFTSILSKLKDKLEGKKIEYLYLDGSTKASERVKLCNLFNESSQFKVFLISLKAGGTGLNLTSAETVVHFDPWWNPAVVNQATDRAYRLGQKKVVNVIKLISKGTIEEKILELNIQKNEMFKTLLDSNELKVLNGVTLTRAEIEYLLS